MKSQKPQTITVNTMQTIITKTTVYDFDELTDEAKEKALDELRTWDLYGWHDENRASLYEWAKAFGASVADYSYGLWGHSYAVVRPGEDPELTGLRLRTWVINNYGHVLTQPQGFGPYVEQPSGTYRKRRVSRIMVERASCPFTGYCTDDILLAPVYNFVYKYNEREHGGMVWQDLLQECADAWVSACVSDLEYSQSDEYLMEEIEQNEYTFTETGEYHAV